MSKRLFVFGLACLIGGLAVILYTTLLPFTFAWRPFTLAELAGAFGLPPSSGLDFPRNVLLFMPFGFGLGAVLARRGTGRGTTAVVTLLLSFLLTLTVESLQFFLPGRTPTVSDLIANTLGGLLGLGCLWLWQDRARLTQTAERWFTVPRLAAIALFYTAAFMLLLAYLANGMRPTNWDDGFALALGNEQTGDRSWEGALSDLTLAARVPTAAQTAALLNGDNPADVLADSATAYYPLEGAADLSDRLGSLPDLVWEGTPASTHEGQGVELSPGNWLRSAADVGAWSTAVADSGELALFFAVLPETGRQEGPARMVTVSADPFARNLTLGHESTALAVRVRTPLTGENGADPELLFGDLLGTRPQWLLVTYNGVTAVVESSLHGRFAADLVPGVAFARLFHPGDYWQLNQKEPLWLYDLWFYATLFVPLGLLAGLAALRVAGWWRRLLLFLGLVGAPTAVLLWRLSLLQRTIPLWQDAALGLAVGGLLFVVVLGWGYGRSATAAG